MMIFFYVSVQVDPTVTLGKGGCVGWGGFCLVHFAKDERCTMRGIL